MQHYNIGGTRARQAHVRVRHRQRRANAVQESKTTWEAFIDGPLYISAHPPWCDDAAFAMIAAHPGLRHSLGGHVASALTLAVDWVQALSGLDVVATACAPRPAQGLCLGFGQHALEAYDLLQVFALDRVHAYEWIAAEVIAAARTLQSLRRHEPLLPTRLRLHHGTLSDLHALADASIRVIYTAHVFNHEIPMTPETFAAALQEMLRVLAEGGMILSRGSTGRLEAQLARHGRMLLHNPLVSVFQKGSASLAHPPHASPPPPARR